MPASYKNFFLSCYPSFDDVSVFEWIEKKFSFYGAFYNSVTILQLRKPKQRSFIYSSEFSEGNFLPRNFLNEELHSFYKIS